MVIDTSAILAMLLDEPEADAFARLVEADPVVLVSAVSRVEATFVIEGRKGDAGRVRLDRFFALAGAEVIPVSAEQAEVACEAFRRYGKTHHPANLNFGDVFLLVPASLQQPVPQRYGLAAQLACVTVPNSSVPSFRYGFNDKAIAIRGGCSAA